MVVILIVYFKTADAFIRQRADWIAIITSSSSLPSDLQEVIHKCLIVILGGAGHVVGQVPRLVRIDRTILILEVLGELARLDLLSSVPEVFILAPGEQRQGCNAKVAIASDLLSFIRVIYIWF